MIHFGMYAPVPHVTLMSPEITESIHLADGSLPDGQVDPAFQLTKDTLIAADNNHFDIVLFAERHLGPDLEAWILASSIASLTRNIQIMPAVHPGLWHPAMVAKMASTLDRISPGRLALNVVTGWNEEEYRMFGGGDLLIGTQGRYARAEEFIEIIRALWKAKGPYSYKGHSFTIEGTDLQLKPGNTKLPDMYTAARSQEGLEMVAKSSDCWFVDYDKKSENQEQGHQNTVKAIQEMQQRTAKYKRKIRYALNPFVVCEETDAKAAKTVQKIIEQGSDHDDGRLFARRMLPALKTGFVGSPETIAELMHRYHEAGVELFLMKFPPTVEEVEKLGQIKKLLGSTVKAVKDEIYRGGELI